jgi:hypothetical protein
MSDPHSPKNGEFFGKKHRFAATQRRLKLSLKGYSPARGIAL